MLLELTVGVRPANGAVTCANDAALRVATLAESAMLSGTFGVGGMLIDRQGQVLAEAMNAVVRNGVVCDPTAHAERQLVDWYFATRSQRKLPPVRDLVIITSLDPCAMCAGAILKSGLSAVAVAAEPMSGVHDQAGLPHRMPQEIWATAEKQLAMFPVRGRSAPSTYNAAVVIEGVISKEARAGCQRAFEESTTRVRSMIGGSPGDLPRKFAPESVMRSLRALPIKLPSGTFLPPADLDAVTGTNSGAWMDVLGEDRACLMDDGGRPILFAQGSETASPIRDSILELVRAYTSLRNLARETQSISLPHPRQCSVLMRRAPESPVVALLDLGALGSFLEERRYASAFPLLTFLEGSDDRIQGYAASLPPLYAQEIGVTVGRLRSEFESPCGP